MKEPVSITTTSFAQYDTTPILLLKNRGFRIITNTFGRKLKKQEIPKLCSNSVAIIAGTEIYDSGTLGKLSKLKMISRCGTGMDNIDLAAATKLGIKVFNTFDEPALAVAELTVGLILALLRKIPFMDREMRDGIWKKRMGNLLFDKQVGIIGFGRVGRKVAGLLRAIGANVFYTDPIVKEKDKDVFPRMDFKDLLKKSDIISLHLSYSEGSYKLLGHEEFSLMRQGAFLINCSRGGTVDEKLLYSALKKGKLTGAAIDVFEQEPYKGPLKELDNVILTPHIGSYARETRIKIELQAVENLLKGGL